MASLRPSDLIVPEENHAPRVEGERYGVYVVEGRDELRLLATSDKDGLGAALIAQDDDARAAGLRGLVDRGRVGILDRIERRWVLMPWHRGERR